MPKKLIQYLGITLGIFITAVGMNLFFIPHKIAAGGISGLSTVLHYLFGFPVGVLMLVFNVPIFLLGLKVLGTNSGVTTVYGAVGLSLFIDLTAPYCPVITGDILLNSLYGGLMCGVGMGLTFRFRGNTAGTSLLAAVVNRLFGVSVGQALLMFDVFVVAFAGFVFKSSELSLYAVISIFVTSKLIDMVQEGPKVSKAFLIMANDPDKLAAKILTTIDRGVTHLQGRGGYTGQVKDMLLCVVETTEVSVLKELVYSHDPKAFLIIHEAAEVLGEGFKLYPNRR